MRYMFLVIKYSKKLFQIITIDIAMSGVMEV